MGLSLAKVVSVMPAPPPAKRLLTTLRPHAAARVSKLIAALVSLQVQTSLFNGFE